MDDGHRKDVSRKELQVGTWNNEGTYFEYLGEEIDTIKCKEAAIELFKTMRDIKNDFFQKKNS
jgi:hypothetical protein